MLAARCVLSINKVVGLVDRPPACDPAVLVTATRHCLLSKKVELSPATCLRLRRVGDDEVMAVRRCLLLTKGGFFAICL